MMSEEEVRSAEVKKADREPERCCLWLDMGKVMGVMMGKLKGKAEGSVVSSIVKEELA